jgi:hypothetical protein
MRPYLHTTDASALLGVRLQTHKAQGRIYTAYPNLANLRWLLPANQPALRRAGIEGLYQPNSLRGRALKTIIGAGALQGQKVWLQEDDLERLETMVASVLGVEGVRLAFYLGVPAPHRKVTAQVLTPLGKTLAYAKIATSELAREALDTERRALLRLSQSKALQGTVPKVLGSVDWQGSTIVLISHGSPHPRSKRALLCAPALLEASFQLLQGAKYLWAESPCCMCPVKCVNRLLHGSTLPITPSTAAAVPPPFAPALPPILR